MVPYINITINVDWSIFDDADNNQNAELDARFGEWVKKLPSHISQAFEQSQWELWKGFQTKASDCNRYRAVIHDDYIRLYFQ